MEAQSPSERAYRGLVRGLYEGRFAPGQRLIAPDLMAEFRVGRGTIREVLHRLTSSGVVSIIPNRGAEVRRLSRREVGEVLDIVELLLGLAARDAATAMDDEDNKQELRSRSEALLANGRIEDFSRFIIDREAYYRCIVRLGGNHELQRLFPTLQVHIMRAQLRPFDRAADSVDPGDYSALTQAMLSGDVQGAEQAARDHVRLTIARVAALPDRAFNPEN